MHLIQLFNYRTYNSCHKSKIRLTHNTFSFLKEGTKEVITNNKAVTIENDEFLMIKSGNCLMTEYISSDRQTYNSILLFFSDEVLLHFLERNKIQLPNTNPAVVGYNLWNNTLAKASLVTYYQREKK